MVQRYLTILLFFSFLAPCYPHPASKPALKSSSSTCFIENKGQIIDQNNKPNPAVLYLLNSPGFNVQLRKTGFSYDIHSIEYKLNPHPILSVNHNPLNPKHHSDSLIPYYQFHRIDISLEGSNRDCQIIPSDPLPDYLNYFSASVPPDGIKHVKQYKNITYRNIYPGIDIEFFTNETFKYKYNFVIHPGANINEIRLRINGPDHISLIQDTLKFGTRFGTVEELIPESYYISNDSRHDIRGRFIKIDQDIYGFSYDGAIPANSLLIIDPTLVRVWGTYYGGSSEEEYGQCAVDKDGNVFLTGQTMSTNNIASTGAYQVTLAGNYDAFLAKFNVAGQRQWGTYVGGPGLDELWGGSIAIDKNENIYVSGYTNSTSGIASATAHQKIYGGGLSDCFLEKFNTSGERLWGTYYGGSRNEIDGAVSTDKNGNVFLCGTTNSDTGISTPGSYQQSISDTGNHVFLAKFDSTGVRQWGTYYAGDHFENGYNCTTDRSGNVYFTGNTNSDSNIATLGAFQTTFGGFSDAFLVKFSNGGQRIWATYYGGSAQDDGIGCSSDSAGNILLVGDTYSSNGIASPGCHQANIGGASDAFIVKFDSLGQRLWGTYYGGTSLDNASNCSVGSENDIFMAGGSYSSNNISTPNAYQQVKQGICDAFLVKFNAAGQRIWGTYFGGSSWDWFGNCAYVPDDTIYVGGQTQSSNNIASSGSWQEVYAGSNDDILIKFLDCSPADTAGPIAGPVNVCLNSTGILYSIPVLRAATIYLWSVPAGATITGGGGTNSITVSFSPSASSGTISVYGINKCDDNGDTAYLAIIIHARPVPVISGPNNTCAGPGKVYLTAPGKTNYQWSVSAGGVITSGGTPSDNIATVTWSVIGTQHVYVNYTDTSGCEALNPADYSVTVTPSPVVAVTINASSNNICEGTLITYTATPVNGGGNPSYQWQVNGINAGSNSSVYSFSPSNNDKVTCILTSSITGCILNNPAISNQITMVVNPILPVSLSISASENPFCQDSNVTFTATQTNGGTIPSYQWKVNGGNIGPDNPVYSYVPNNGDIVSCVLTSDIPCPTGNPATSNSITMVENTNVTVSVSITPSANPVCVGTSVTYTATPVNGGTPPVFQWKVNGIIVGTNNPVYTYIPVNGDVITCVLTSNALCASGNPATSNAVTMVVNPLNPVSVTISPSANPVCSGISVTYTATPGNGGSTPVYQWKVNGVIVGTNNPIFNYTPVNGDIVICILTSNILCPTGNPATSNAITMTVNPNLAVSISISASANPFCQGASVTFTATATNGGAGPSYQWKVNGGNVGPNNPVYSYSPNNGDIVSCVLNSNVVCPTGNPATSNSIRMIVNANLPAGISIAASTNPFCPGNSVTYTATPVNGGPTPAYQWKVNGINAGSNNATYTYNPVSGDLVSCIMTSNLACVTGNPATSNTIIMSGTLAPVVTFTLCNDTITTTNAKPFKLKGGIPLGGTYSGAGVAGGIFNPAIAGVGNHQITYTYTNAALCAASAHSMLHIFNPSNIPCGSPLTDIRDNKVYPTVQIGSQCWMAANLDYGTMIPGNTSQRDNCDWEKYCFNDMTVNCGQQTYYQWDELMQYDETVSTQGFCPPGWHIPTEADWNILFSNYISNGFAGSPLKYSGFSGFNAILSGARHLNKNWDYQGFATFFWSSTAHGTNKAWAHGMNDIDPSVSIYPAFRNNAMSVRCVHD